MHQRQRIVFLDFARGLAIVVMVLQHAMIMYQVNGGEKSLLGTVVLLMGTAPAAPVFMLIMGMFLSRSKNEGLQYGVVRGLKLVALGYVLNLFRFSLPLFVAQQLGESADLLDSATSLFFAVDILQMAGLSLIVMTLVRRFLPWRFVGPALAIVVAVVSPLLWGTLDQWPVTSPLWGSGENVFFPLFPWMIYPLIGMFCGQYLLDRGNSASLMKKWSILGVAMVVVGGLLWAFVSNKIVVAGDYYRSGPAVHLTVLGFVFMWLPFCWWIIERVADNAAFRMLRFWSQHVTVVYFIQWLLIGWGMLVIGYRERNALAALVIGFAALSLTHGLVAAYLRLRRVRKASAAV